MKIDPIIINCESHLFLGGGFLLGLSPSTLLPDTLVAGFTAGLAQTAVGSLLTLGQVITLDLSDSLLSSEVLDGKGSIGASGITLSLALSGEGSLGSADLFSRRVKLLELTTLAGEEDQAGLVVLETINIGDQRLLGVVDTAVVNGDTDGRSELLGDSGFLYGFEASPM